MLVIRTTFIRTTFLLIGLVAAAAIPAVAWAKPASMAGSPVVTVEVPAPPPPQMEMALPKPGAAPRRRPSSLPDFASVPTRIMIFGDPKSGRSAIDQVIGNTLVATPDSDDEDGGREGPGLVYLRADGRGVLRKYEGQPHSVRWWIDTRERLCLQAEGDDKSSADCAKITLTGERAQIRFDGSTPNDVVTLVEGNPFNL